MTPQELQDYESARMRRVMERYRCTSEDAYRYLDLRKEGYGPHQAAVMAGIADPSEAA